MGNTGGLNAFLLIVGNARSGSTLLGSILDSHPDAMVANETLASGSFWRGLDRAAILGEIARNSEHHRKTGRAGGGYSYFSGKEIPAKNSRILLAGDKVWNPATLLLHGDFGLIGRLETTLGVPVKVIHAVRNPFDAIATMHLRSGASLQDRTLWYFMHCDAVCAIRDRLDASRYLDVYHEGLIEEPDVVLPVICRFLGLGCPGGYLDSCRKMLYEKPSQSRYKVTWRSDVVADILRRLPQYPFLHRYAGDNYTDLGAA